MENNIILSIIMPVFGVEKYITHCLESIIPQLTKETELIIIDDCTKDKSIKICNYKLKNINNVTMISHTKNSGISSARNTGILHSKGRYCWFIDSDDYIHEDAIKTILEQLKTEQDVYFFNHLRRKDDGTEVYVNELLDQNYYIDNQREIRSFLCSILRNEFGYEVWSKVFKRDIIINNDIQFPPKITYGEDICFILEFVINCKKIEVINLPIYYYILHKQSMMGRSKGTSKLYEMNGIVFEVLEKYHKKFLNDKDMYLIYGGIMHLAIQHSWNINLYEDLKKLKQNSYNVKMVNTLFFKGKELIHNHGKRNGLMIVFESGMTRAAFKNNKILFYILRYIAQFLKR